MRVEVVHPRQLGPGEVQRWRALQRQLPTLRSPFLASGFALAVGELQATAQVAVLSEGGQIQGFFPFERRSLRYGVPIAAGLTDCQGLVHAGDFEWDPRELLGACRLDVWEFDRLVSGQEPFQPYEHVRAPSPVIDLGQGSESVLARLREQSSRIADKLPRQERRLTRDVGPLRFDYDSRDRSALTRVMAWKSAQYQRTGRSDRFAHPWIVQLLEALFDADRDDAHLVVSTLYAGDEPIAGHVALRLDDVLAGWFPAYDLRYATYSPGMLHRLNLIAAAAADGIRYIELGRGTKESKELFKSHDLVVSEGAVVRSPLGAALYRVGRAPVRKLRQTVLDNPALYRRADRLLKGYGRVRASVSSRST
ncbi:GNAT family N-acetyltransferase [Geodermatophilus sp. SYSU D00742]